MRTLMTAFGAALLALLAMSGVAGALTITELVTDKDAYDGQSVTVTGTVERSLPAFGESAYELRDGRDKVSVVSRTDAPTVGQQLTVSGKVRVFHEGEEGEAESNDFPPYIIEASRTPAP